MPSTSMPAPVGGWNARDALDAIPPTDAVELVNWFPQPGAVYGRGGSVTKLTISAGHPVDTIIPFTSSKLTKLIAACNGNIWDITGLTSATSKASGFTSDQWQSGHFNDKVILVNGADAPQVYDGSTVTASTVSLPGTPTVTLALASGTLAAATYAYRVTATYTNSETAPSTEVSYVLPAKLSAPNQHNLVTVGGAGALPSGTYFYVVTAINAIGETTVSNEKSLFIGSTGKITVSWDAVTGTGDAATTGYKIYRSTTTGTELLLATVGLVTSYDDIGTLTPAGAQPGSNTTSGGIKLTWTASQNPSGYNVYGRTAAGELLMTPSPLGSTVLTFTDDGSVTPSGAMPSTDNTGKNLFAVTNFKGRAFYIELAQCGFWYAAAGAFQGNLSWYPLSFVFHHGGYVVMILTWSRDNGDGVDDMCAFISSNGEALVYQGTDPGNALTWSLVGRFNIGVPLATRAHGKLASAEIVLTTDGFLTMDEAIVNQRAQELQTFGGKIIRAANSASSLYGSNFGWEAIYYPRGNMFLVNVPIASDTFEQYVQNTNTQAWCRFTGWNARTFAVYQNRLYFGTKAGTVVLADTSGTDTGYGYGDDAVSVEHRATQSYQKFNQPGMKSQVTAVELVTNMRYPSKASVNILQDYHSQNLPALTDPPEQNPAQWNVSNWNSDYWATTENMLPDSPDAKLNRYSVSSFAFAHALSFRYLAKKQQLIWYASNFVFKPANV